MDPSSLAQWINREAANLEHQGWAPGSPREDAILAKWRRDRPTMCLRLGGALTIKLAFVLDHLRYQAMLRYMKAGMSQGDAATEATREFLLQEPENPHQPLPPLARISTSPTPPG